MKLMAVATPNATLIPLGPAAGLTRSIVWKESYGRVSQLYPRW